MASPPPPPSFLLSRFDVPAQRRASFGVAMVPPFASAQSRQDASSPPPADQHMEASPSFTSPGSSVLMEWTSERAVNDLKVAESPHCRASLPRKLQLVDQKQGNRHSDGRTGSPLSQISEISPLSRSLPSPGTASFFEEKVDYEEPRTPPDMVFSRSCDVPPTPMAPRKTYKIRSAPLGKKQPRRLHFVAEQGGHDVPANSCSPNAAAAIETPQSPRFSKRGSVPLEFAEDTVESSAVTSSECSQTPPDKFINSFLCGKTPTGPKKLFGASKWRTEWQ